MSKTSLTWTVKSFKAKQNSLWCPNTLGIEDPTALRRNSSETTPVFQQKLTAGVTFSDTADGFGITHSTDAANGQVNNRACHKTSLRGEQPHPLLSPTLMVWTPHSVISFAAISGGPKVFCLFVKKQEQMTEEGLEAFHQHPAPAHELGEQ